MSQRNPGRRVDTGPKRSCPSSAGNTVPPRPRLELLPGPFQGVVAPTAYLLQLGVPRQLLHDQGEALCELQLARPAPMPEQHLSVRGHTQQLEAVAVAGLGQPNHLGQQGVGTRLGKGCLTPAYLPPCCKTRTVFHPFSWGKRKSREACEPPRAPGAGVEGSKVPALAPAEAQDSPGAGGWAQPRALGWLLLQAGL